MDQDEFRRLLSNPTPGTLSSRSAIQSTKTSLLDASKPAFQPRKVKKRKIESTYRDRASDRRAGVNDYAEVESVLEDFEKRTAGVEDRNVVEEQRRYLGGDKDHTILVKGLDFALLEQNKARAIGSQEEDDSLEAAFQESTMPPKRTRDDIIKALKEKKALDRNQSLLPKVEADGLERAKQLGKFKPIGTPEAVKDGVKRLKNGKKDGQPKKKKRKVTRSVHSTIDMGNQEEAGTSKAAMVSPPTISLPSEGRTEFASPQNRKSVLDHPVESEDDYDIFADAGDYHGIDFEDEDEVHPASLSDSHNETQASLNLDDNIQPKCWFKDSDMDMAPIGSSKVHTPTPPPQEVAESGEQEERAIRLAPLASSALPSIHDFLAMDAQVEAQAKRKGKKEKKKGDKKEKDSLELKVNRDYQRLNSYMARKT